MTPLVDLCFKDSLNGSLQKQVTESNQLSCGFSRVRDLCNQLLERVQSFLYETNFQISDTKLIVDLKSAEKSVLEPRN